MTAPALMPARERHRIHAELDMLLMGTPPDEQAAMYQARFRRYENIDAMGHGGEPRGMGR